jgi:hypothetical protein
MSYMSYPQADMNPFTLSVRNNPQVNNIFEAKMMEQATKNLLWFALYLLT